MPLSDEINLAWKLGTILPEPALAWQEGPKAGGTSEGGGCCPAAPEQFPKHGAGCRKHHEASLPHPLLISAPVSTAENTKGKHKDRGETNTDVSPKITDLSRATGTRTAL